MHSRPTSKLSGSSQIHTTGCATPLTEPYIAHQLLDPDARAVLYEIIRCALPASEKIDYKDESGDVVLGARRARPVQDLGSRARVHGMPRVRDCMRRRPGSMRSTSRFRFSLRSVLSPLDSPASKVSTIKVFRESVPDSDPARGILIGSFQPSCTPGHRCGWQAAYVGMCNPGNVFPRDQPGKPFPSRSTTLHVPLRRCESVRAFTAVSGLNSGYPPPADFPMSGPARYVEPRKEQHGACAGAPLVFQCPTDEGSRGLLQHHGPAGPAGIIARAVRGGRPARRNGPRFRRRKPTRSASSRARFYGNLFRPDQLKRSCEVTPDGKRAELHTPARHRTRLTRRAAAVRSRAVALRACPTAPPTCVW